MSPRILRFSVSIVVLALAAAACGGGGTSEETTTVPTTSLPSTSVAETTTTLGPDTTTTVVNTLPEPLQPLMPLSGHPITDEAVANRPALVVKIDNHPRARPQSGMNQADIVFEEIVEQGTRFAAVFHSEVADPVGPIRSGRTQDIELLGAFNYPLFAWSGGNAGVTAAVRASDLQDVGALTNFAGGGYYRSPNRSAPHNLYAQGSMLMTLASAFALPPPQQFAYREGSAVEGGVPNQGARLSMDGLRVQWDWNSDFGLYQRRQADERHLLADGAQVDAKNIVIMVVEYRPSPADPRSPEAQTVGEGFVWVLSGGQVFEGSWSRPVASEPFRLITSDGVPILLEPGRTWVELVRPFKAAIVPADVDPASIPYP